MIQSLSDRYPPTSAISTEQRKRQLQLLAEDIAEFPVHLIEKAIKHLVLHSAFMPKAFDIVQLVKSFAQAEQPKNDVENARRLARERNDYLDRTNPSFGGRWITDSNGSLSIVPRENLNKRQEPRCTPEQAAEIMKEFKIKSSILAPIVGALKPERRNPTAADIAEIKREMGIVDPPTAEAAE